MKRIVLTRFSAVVLLFAGPVHTRAQSRSPSFQYVVTGEGVHGIRTDTAHPGSRQLVHFSNDNLTIAASIEVEEIRGGVALVRVRAKSCPGRVDRETCEKGLQSARSREYTYVPTEKLSMPVDGGGVLALVGAIADEAGNLSKPLAFSGDGTWPDPAYVSRALARRSSFGKSQNGRWHGAWPARKSGCCSICSFGRPLHFCSPTLRGSLCMSGPSWEG